MATNTNRAKGGWTLRVVFLMSKKIAQVVNMMMNFLSFSSKSSEECPSGLLNSTSVCYMNAMIQAAASSDVLNKEFESLQTKYSNCCSLNLFINLLHGVNTSGNSNKSVRRNTKLLHDLIKSIKWNKPSQQDAFDLFSAVIKGIEEEMKKHVNEKIKMPMKIELIHRFKGMDIPDKVQNHLGLSVGLYGNYSKKPGESVEFLIKEHFSPTVIDDDPSKTTQMFFYQQAPDVLLIHIQANKWDYERGEMYKPEYHIDYKENMNLTISVISEMNTEKMEKEVKYTLIGFVKHTGTISGGHYVTYRRFREKWFYVNDNRVKQWEYNSRNVPYIMIYEKTT